MKRLTYYLYNILFKISFFLCRCLPEETLAAFFSFFASIFLRLSRRYRKRINNNLQIAFGRSSHSQSASTITDQLADNMGRGALETLLSATGRRESILKRIELQGSENLESALAGGRGVIAVSAHLGSFTLMGMKMVASGYPFTMLVKEPEYNGIARSLRSIQSMQGGRFIYLNPWKEALRKIMELLRSNEIVCFLSDERKRNSEVYVDFFGCPVATAAGAAVFSLKTGAPLVPVFIIRNADKRSHTIIIEPQLKVPLTGNRTGDIVSLTAAFTSRIEHYVRQYPDQWFWLNNRWKRKDTRRVSPGSVSVEVNGT